MNNIKTFSDLKNTSGNNITMPKFKEFLNTPFAIKEKGQLLGGNKTYDVRKARLNYYDKITK